MKDIDGIANGLLILGAINWGLALLNANLITALLGTGMLAQLIYGLIGLAGVYTLIKLK